VPDTADAAFDQLVETRSPQVRELAVRTRELVRRELPDDVLETVDGVDVGYGWTRGYRGMICAIGVHAGWVNLALADGAALPDPAGLLRGTGKRHRYVRIADPSDLEQPALVELVRAAVIAHPHPDRTSTTDTGRDPSNSASSSNSP
jgi:hypothetical protein